MNDEKCESRKSISYIGNKKCFEERWKRTKGFNISKFKHRKKVYQIFELEI